MITEILGGVAAKLWPASASRPRPASAWAWPAPPHHRRRELNPGELTQDRRRVRPRPRRA
jgi:hypothetical protein